MTRFDWKNSKCTTPTYDSSTGSPITVGCETCTTASVSRNKELFLDPAPLEADTWRVFKRGLKHEVRTRMEMLPDSALLATFAGYAEFAIKCEQELLLNKQRGRTYRDIPASYDQNDTVYDKPVTRDYDGDVEMTMNAMRGNAAGPGVLCDLLRAQTGLE
jgi:hypothetical protein